MILNLKKTKTTIKPYLLFISNVNEMGYKLSFTPKAKLQDGYLDLVVVPELTIPERIKLLIYLLMHKFESFKKAKHILVRDLIIEVPDGAVIEGQIDGELYSPKANTLIISVIKKSLKIITDYRENLN